MKPSKAQSSLLVTIATALMKEAHFDALHGMGAFLSGLLQAPFEKFALVDLLDTS